MCTTAGLITVSVFKHNRGGGGFETSLIFGKSLEMFMRLNERETCIIITLVLSTIKWCSNYCRGVEVSFSWFEPEPKIERVVT